MTTQPDTTADDFLMGGGVKSASFKGSPPIVVQGVITDPPQRVQARDPDDGSLRTWDNGDPIWQLRVRLQTDQRDDAEDNGIRDLYVKGASGKPELEAEMSMTQAVRAAVEAAGAPGLRVGGTLAVQFHAEGKAKRAAFNPPKFYRAKYVPPTGDSDSFLGAQAATASAGLAQADAVAAAPPATAQQAVPAVDPAHIATAKALITANQPDAVILLAAPSVTPEILTALRNAPPF